MARSVSMVFFLAILSTASGQGDFLGHKVNAESIHLAIQGTLGDMLGSGHGVEAANLVRIKGVLAPIFDVLPKNNRGRLNDPFMRYAVQRYFSQSRGWMVKGYASAGSRQNTSDVEILESNFPAQVQAELQKTLSHDGFALQDMVVAVASIERLIFNEVAKGVETAYQLNELSMFETVSNVSDMTSVLVSYFAVEHLQGNSTNIKRHKFERKNIARFYPYWPQTFEFIEDTAGNDAYQQRGSLNPFTEQTFHFEDVARISGHVNEDFGFFSRHECSDIKAKLAEKDVYGTGRVKLADFYSAGAWQFRESPDYLRLIGALDESSESQGPQVIIPNYVLGMNNCITSTLYYDICCLNECDGVFQHLEARIRAPSASVAEIAQAIEEGITTSSAVLSSTAPTGARNLSVALRARLEDIAAQHNDAIPLHGRLLGQWLHYAFPQECPFPHMSGTVDQKSPREAALAKVRVHVTKDQLRLHNESEFSLRAPSPEAGQGMWSLQEELIEVSAPAPGLRALVGSGFKIMLLVFSAGLFLKELARVARSQSGTAKPGKGTAVFAAECSYDV